jgi:HEAT repeat protein
MEAARDPNPEVRHHALMGLACDPGKPPIPNEALIAFLGECVADDDPSASHSAASALKPYDVRLAADVLLPHLNDARPHVREAAVWGIWAHRDDDVLTELVRLLREDPEAKIRKGSAWGLGVTCNPKAESLLLEAIASETDPAVIEIAKKSLGSIRDEQRCG